MLVTLININILVNNKKKPKPNTKNNVPVAKEPRGKPRGFGTQH